MINSCLANSALSNGLYIHNYTHLITSSAIKERLQFHTLSKQLLKAHESEQDEKVPFTYLNESFQGCTLRYNYRIRGIQDFFVEGNNDASKIEIPLYLHSICFRQGYFEHPERYHVTVFELLEIKLFIGQNKGDKMACFGRNKICEFA